MIQTRVDVVRADGVDAEFLQEGPVARAAGGVRELVDDWVCAVFTFCITCRRLVKQVVRAWYYESYIFLSLASFLFRSFPLFAFLSYPFRLIAL
jgi:hypothetical protein